MSASVMHSAPIYAAFGRMHSVEELDSSLTLLSRHNILPKPLPITPPGTPIAQSPEESFEYSPESPSATIPPNTPVTPAGNLGPLRVNTCGGSAEQKLPNIDNKIEQAMDLVKTHLTFAVREEIEVLRQTIHELEQKVSNIEQENQLLRQFAPAHIVADLPQMLALQRQTNAQAAASRAPAVPAPTSAPKIAPEGFCSTSFANTLNNVVADVRQQIRSIPPAPRDPQ